MYIKRKISYCFFEALKYNQKESLPNISLYKNMKGSIKDISIYVNIINDDSINDANIIANKIMSKDMVSNFC